MKNKIQICMTLCSDTILSSGYAIPGGDDINIYKDSKGKPFFKGTSFKGILRENIANLLSWTGQNTEILDDLFGVESLSTEKQERKLKFSSFTTDESEDFYTSRIFTSIENGVSKEGSLRSAEIIKKGLKFSGYIICDEQDTKLILDGLRAVKWIGSNKSRGFGQVLIENKVEIIDNNTQNIENAEILYYKFKTKLPIIITKNKKDNDYTTYQYITGSVIRGMILNEISRNNSDFFAKNKKNLLQTRFLNTVLADNDNIFIPTIKGFYENKDQTDLENVVVKGEISVGKKRAKLGTFCAIKDNKILYKSTKTSSVTRINQSKKSMFSTESIDENQIFEGYIILKDSSLSSEISKAFAKEFFIGADRNQGFGLCELLELKSVEKLKYNEKYASTPQKELYMVAISPFTMRNEIFEPCGIDKSDLAKKLGVNSVEIEICSTEIIETNTFNAMWSAKSSKIPMYEQGSIFKIICDTEPTKINEIYKNGLGINTELGFGQVIFMNLDILDAILVKESEKNEVYSKNSNKKDKIKKWIMENSVEINNMKTSRSQISEIERICKNEDINELNSFLNKNTDSNYPNKNATYKDIKYFIDNFMQSLDFKEENKFKILCELFAYSRKKEVQNEI